MKRFGISLILCISTLLILCAPMNLFADDNAISILNYSLKPVGYVSGNRFIQSIWNIELKNNEATPHSFNIKVVFYDKDNNQLKEVTKDVDIDATETRKFSDAVLLEPDIAKKVATTKAFIEKLS